MKKFAVLLSAMFVMMSLAACGGEDQPSKMGEPQSIGKIGESVSDAVGKGLGEIAPNKTGIQEEEPAEEDYDPATYWDTNPAAILWNGNFVMSVTEELEGQTMSIMAEVCPEDEYLYFVINAGDAINLSMAYEGSDGYMLYEDQAYHFIDEEGEESSVVIDTDITFENFSYLESKDGYDIYDISDTDSGETTHIYVQHDTKTAEKIVIDGSEYEVRELTEKSFSAEQLSDVQEISADDAATMLMAAFFSTMPGDFEVQPE